MLVDYYKYDDYDAAQYMEREIYDNTDNDVMDLISSTINVYGYDYAIAYTDNDILKID